MVGEITGSRAVDRSPTAASIGNQKAGKPVFCGPYFGVLRFPPGDEPADDATVAHHR